MVGEFEEKKDFFKGLYALDDIEIRDTFGDNEVSEWIRKSKRSSTASRRLPQNRNVISRERSRAHSRVDCRNENGNANGNEKIARKDKSLSSRIPTTTLIEEVQKTITRTTMKPSGHAESSDSPSRSIPTSATSRRKDPSPTKPKTNGRGRGKNSNIKTVRPPTPPPSTVNKKRKPEPDIVLKPEDEQLFKGLTFCFAPREYIGVRKFRMNKCLQNGVSLSKECNEDTTHLVIEKQWTLEQAKEYLKIPEIPEHVVIVNDDYPPDCLHFGRLLDHTQKMYDIAGGRILKPAVVECHSSNSPDLNEDEPPNSNTSLQIKPEKKKQIEHTPSRSIASLQPSADDRPQPNTSPPLDQQNHLIHAGPVFHDALDHMIEEARKFSALPLPLDEDDDQGDLPLGTDSEDSERECSERTNKRRKITSKTDKAGGLSGFQCMSKHDGMELSKNPNSRTIEILDQMQKYYDKIGDNWRSIGYRKAISTLKKQTKKVLTAEDAMGLPFIGQRLACKIEEIVWTNNLRRLEYAKTDPDEQIRQLFLGVYGCGTVQAQRWLSSGYRTLTDLLTKAKLTDNQRIGVEHYNDFNSRIPREEVTKHGEIVKMSAMKIDPELTLEVMGSYRRGSKDCGDIDILITKPNASLPYLTTVLDALTSELYKIDFLQCTLASSHNSSGSKFHGASQLSPNAPWRRIDFLLVPWDERGAALIYFTGNDIFNRSLRLLASKKGYRLNQKGLYKDVMRGANRLKISEGLKVEGESERRIFEILGVKWRPPEHRIC